MSAFKRLPLSPEVFELALSTELDLSTNAARLLASTEAACAALTCGFSPPMVESPAASA